MPAFECKVEASPDLDDIQYLEDRLYEYNSSTTGIDDGQYLAIFVRDEAGKIVGGIAGSTWGACCELRQLWVDKSQRGQGLGRQLLAAAEEEARRRQCAQIVLSSYSFQAPQFYVKYGFEIVFAMDDWPRGHKQVMLRKRLES